MMAPVVDACRRAGVECQASLERHMKCGFGVCGQCECDGRLVCQDGPVFSAGELAKMPSFGRHTRLKSGRKVGISGQDHCAVRRPDPPEGA
jgi:dihydroorotate dehydrogenase electron transfer subunit